MKPPFMSRFSQLSHNYSEKSNEQGLFLDILFAVNGSAFLISSSAGWLLMCGKAIIFVCMLIVLCITWLNCLSDLKFCYRKTQAATAIWIVTNGLIFGKHQAYSAAVGGTLCSCVYVIGDVVSLCGSFC